MNERFIDRIVHKKGDWDPIIWRSVA
jgi:hypothetical protein